MERHVATLAGKVVLIVGASSGVGRAVGELLAREGAAVALLARRAAILEQVVAGIAGDGGRALALPADVTDEHAVAAAVERASRWGDGLDAVVNCAGLGLVGAVEHFAYDDWRRMAAVNLGGAFLLARAAIPRLRERGGGQIVAVGSEFSRAAMAGLAAYCATKWGLLGFMHALALELRPHNIRCSTILPGGILTDFGPDDLAGKLARQERGERFLQPSDVAEAVRFLLTQPASAWTQELNIWPV